MKISSRGLIMKRQGHFSIVFSKVMQLIVPFVVVFSPNPPLPGRSPKAMLEIDMANGCFRFRFYPIDYGSCLKEDVSFLYPWPFSLNNTLLKKTNMVCKME